MDHYERLVARCVEALATFDPSSTSVEDHLERFLVSSEKMGEGEEEEEEVTFVREVVAGCVRYQQLIKVVVSGFYRSPQGRSCLRADSCLYNVVCYLLLFRLQEIGPAQWRRLVLSLNTTKMYKFLSLTLSEDNLNGWITSEWYKVYDREFVDRSILSPLKSSHDELLTLVRELEEHLANKTQSKPAPKPPTEVAPFNLTKPQPRSLPTPEKIPGLKPHRPVPVSTYTRPAEQEKLAEAFRSNRLIAETTLEEARRTQFACATAEKSEKTKARMEEIVVRRVAELQFRPRRPEPVPVSVLEEGPPVKMNTAAVLREGARVQNELLLQEKRLASLEAGEKDSGEFTRWQEDMKQREAAERETEVERRHLEARLSYEDAIIAKESHLRHVQQRAQAMKEESQSLMQAYFAEREEERREMRRLVEAAAGQNAAKEARAQLQAMKKSIVEAVSEESRSLMARALEEAEEEMQCKAELIRQIRAMERVHVPRTKLVDLTQTGGQGLLVEMSVAELRERLGLLRVAEAQEEERRRRDIATSKQVRSLSLVHISHLLCL
ncbi:Cilia- and flagella-associated protein 99 [Geodia barretti]|uniref:Cilia- and flagella-associated protein 99 n=1 Tax=Geodia barretti TaxID=519541 RepID=A0AA35R380_GEOBA|nr:Cilia- and flagella-associated protein 99 [Geodia barretti]